MDCGDDEAAWLAVAYEESEVFNDVVKDELERERFSIEEDESLLEDLAQACELAEKHFNEGAEPSTSIESDIQCSLGYEGPPPSNDHLDVLHTLFGHAQFRPVQWKIIRSILEDKRDNCVVMATGYGKSLCYQYAAVYSRGLAVVISPLISLMEDQVLALQVSNIPACLLGSAQTQKAATVNNILSGAYRLVYLAPEFCMGDYGQDLLVKMHKQVGLSLVAIDEAHCVSQWGHDFRASYRKLGTLRNQFPDVPFLAVTATATPEVQRDICSSLKLRNPLITCTGFDRPNLYLEANLKGSDILMDLKKVMKKINGKYEFEGSTIIYCPTKKQTEKVVAELRVCGFDCAAYHANISMKTRKEVHEKFVKDQLKLIVATIAFGMGIDKPDVRQVIHYGAARDLESYYQESGRAGRDGLPSQSFVFYNSSDFNVHRYFLSSITSQAYQEKRLNMIRQMEKFLATKECRRSVLLSHFMGKPVKRDPAYNCCDNCRRKLNEVSSAGYLGTSHTQGEQLHDFGKEAKMMLEAVNICRCRGMAVCIMVIRGSKNNRIPPQALKHKVYGSGRDYSDAWWKALGKMLLDEGFLEQRTQSFSNFGRGKGKPAFVLPTVHLTRKGEQFLSKCCSNPDTELKLIPSPEMQDMLKVKVRRTSEERNRNAPVCTENSWYSSNVSVVIPAGDLPEKKQDLKKFDLEDMLHRELIELRNELSNAAGCMPYMVANSRSLIELARLRPTTKAQLLKLGGFSEAKVEKFGTQILKKIQEFSLRHSLSQGAFVECLTESPPQLSQDQLETHRLFEDQKKSVDEIAAQKLVQRSLVMEDLTEAIKAGLPVTVERLGVSDTVREMIEEAFKSSPIDSDLSKVEALVEQVPNFISREQILITMALLTRTYEVTGASKVDWKRHRQKIEAPVQQFKESKTAELEVTATSSSKQYKSEEKQPAGAIKKDFLSAFKFHKSHKTLDSLLAKDLKKSDTQDKSEGNSVVVNNPTVHQAIVEEQVQSENTSVVNKPMVPKEVVEEQDNFYSLWDNEDEIANIPSTLQSQKSSKVNKDFPRDSSSNQDEAVASRMKNVCPSDPQSKSLPCHVGNSDVQSQVEKEPDTVPVLSSDAESSHPKQKLMVVRKPTSSVESKRKLPEWLQDTNTVKQEMKRKMKKNTLFKM